MNEHYRTSNGKLVSVTSANGSSGYLIRSCTDGAWYLRIYTSDDKSRFDDYRLRHEDLAVTINDESAAFYRDAQGNTWLDYEPVVYGLSREGSKGAGNGRKQNPDIAREK